VAEGTTLDLFFDGQLTLRQPANGHRIGTDAMLLVALARTLQGQRAADFGAGAGAAGLGLTLLDKDRHVVLVEQDATVAAMARENVERNNLGDVSRVAEADVTSAASMRAAGIGPASLDLVIMNPPFLGEGKSRVSPIVYRRSAHVMPEGGLGAWVKAARRTLVPGGWLAMIHRADAIGDVLAQLATGFGSIRLMPIQPSANAPATRLLVAARTQSKAPTVIWPALVLHEADGAFTPSAKAIHAGTADFSGTRAAGG
jgi:tRNA1(Val) A37 N6-methylase TrmN6